MLRRLLTALALLTGLAAAGVPAEARAIAAVSEQVVAGAQRVAGTAQLICIVSPRRSVGPGRIDARPVCRQRTAPTVYLPTVQIGPDRAHE